MDEYIKNSDKDLVKDSPPYTSHTRVGFAEILTISKKLHYSEFSIAGGHIIEMDDNLVIIVSFQ